MLARLCSSALASVRTFVLVLVRARAFVLCSRIIVLVLSRLCSHVHARFVLVVARSCSCSYVRSC